MADLATLQARRDHLEQMMASGTLTARDAAGNSVTYRTMAELEAAYRKVLRDIAKAEGKTPLRRAHVYSQKGFGNGRGKGW